MGGRFEQNEGSCLPELARRYEPVGRRDIRTLKKSSVPEQVEVLNPLVAEEE